jgi:hypothetical protein
LNEGRLDLEIDWDGRAVTGVGIANSRPAAARLLVGRTPAEALAAVPLLFSACRHGQGAAARLALAAAEGEDVPVSSVPVAAEAALERLWRLLLDWPKLLGMPASEGEFAGLYRRLSEAAGRGDWGDTGRYVAEFCERELFGMPAEAWTESLRTRDFGGAGLAKLLAALAAEPAAGDMPPVLPAGLGAVTYFDGLPHTFGEKFSREPTWQSAPAETGALARVEAAPVKTGLPPVALRVWALAAELAAGVAEMSGRSPPRRLCDGFSPEPGRGFAVTETARGLLMHAVCLAAGRIAEYVIVAPTEWNFHPEGPFRQGLIGLEADRSETLERAARRLALALDPCVSFGIAVRQTVA